MLFSSHCSVCFIKKQLTHALAVLSVFFSFFFSLAALIKSPIMDLMIVRNSEFFFSLALHNLFDENENCDVIIKA